VGHSRAQIPPDMRSATRGRHVPVFVIIIVIVVIVIIELASFTGDLRLS
jgi:hypothetical protein